MFSKIFMFSMLVCLINTSIGLLTHAEKHFINPDVRDDGDDIRKEKNIDGSLFELPVCKENCLDDDYEVARSEIMKRGHGLQDGGNQIMVERKFNHLPSLFCHHRKSCGCGREKRMIDMGPDYFPRYISDMLCIPGGCDIHHECRPKRSKVWAIRRRQEDEFPGTEPVPKELREFWIGETIAATVDCECTRI